MRVDLSHTPDRFTSRQYDLFGAAEEYPQFPGAKEPTTRLDAAICIADYARGIRGAALKEFRAAYPNGLTADEVAGRCGASQFGMRPRISELRKAGLIEPTPDTRPNPTSGIAARVWRATAAAME